MKSWVSILSILVLVMAASVTLAENPAATSELPAALTALGAQSAVMTADEAHQVRGKWFALEQRKGFEIDHGVATGGTALLEGIFGTFESIDFQNGGAGGDSITIMGTFGGLTGDIDQTSNGLNFNVLGKALQESIDFSGKFSQDFFQRIKIPVD